MNEPRRSGDQPKSDFTAMRWMPNKWRNRVFLAVTIGAGLASFAGWFFKVYIDTKVGETTAVTSSAQTDLVNLLTEIATKLNAMAIQQKKDIEVIEKDNRALKIMVAEIDKAQDGYEEIQRARHKELMDYLINTSGKGKRGRAEHGN